MRRYISKVPEDMVGERTGQQEQMRVALREVDPFSLWVRHSDSSSRAACWSGCSCNLHACRLMLG